MQYNSEHGKNVLSFHVNLLCFDQNYSLLNRFRWDSKYEISEFYICMFVPSNWHVFRCNSILLLYHLPGSTVSGFGKKR